MILMWFVFAVGLAAKIPVAFVLILSAAGYILQKGISLTVIAQQLGNSISGYTLIAVPLYILVGEIMNTGGITRRLFGFARGLAGHIPGGLAHVNILASMIFAGISGSSSADAAGLGRIEIQAMVEEGYDREFSATITAVSSMLGPIIPPSIHLVLYSGITDVSVAKLFAGGLLPGLLLGLSLMIFVYFLAVTGREHCPVRPRQSLAGVIRAFREALFPMLAPVLILSGILLGIVTATEAAALAVVYCVVLAAAYREVGVKDVPRIFKNTIVSTGVVMLILAAGQLFAWVLTLERLPELFIAALYSVTSSRVVILLVVDLIFLVVGCFLPATSGLLILTPIMVQVARSLGIDMVHLGVWMVFGLMIGVVTPPVGASLYIVSDIAKVSPERLTKRSMPYYIPLLFALLVVTFWPALSTFLPGLLAK
ncbi:MAG: TRAP transporter large permease [Firmicutes bacterium]|jgi:tripartite ATP-independent transporter DctM subunit|nr:TRAP transporter large permease [Bacillota bacterium]